MARLTQRRSLLAACVVFLAFSVSMWDIDGRSLWFDEGMEYWVATSPIQDMARNVRRGIQDPPLYSLLLHLWMSLGRNELYLRFPSVVFSILGIAGMTKLGDSLGGSPTGLVAATMMALLPPQIRYAQEAGQYALMGSLLVWNLLALYRMRVRPSWATSLLWTLSALSATYAYYGAAIVVLMTSGVELGRSALHRRWRSVARGIGTIGLYSICTIPLLVFFLPRQLQMGPTTEAFHIVFSSPLLELRDLAVSTQELTAFVFSGWPWTPVSKWLSSSLVAILLLRSFLAGRESNDLGRVWLWLVPTWAAYYALGKLNLFPYGFRYGLILVPLLIPTTAVGICTAFLEKHRAAVGAVCTLLLLLTCVVSLPNLAFRSLLYPDRTWAWPETEQLQPVVEYWFDRGGATIPTYVYYGAVPAFSYYVTRHQSPEEIPATWYAECWRGYKTGYCSQGQLHYGRSLRRLIPEKKVQSVLDTLSHRPDAFWLVFSHVYADEDKAILGGLSSHYRVVESYTQANAQLHLLQREAR